MSDAVDHVLCVRAWGIPDRRVASGLAHENQPAHTFREEAIGQRARDAGWPPATFLQIAQRQTRRLEKLEGSSWHHRAQSKRTYRRRYGPDPAPADTLIRDDGPATIFDE